MPASHPTLHLPAGARAPLPWGSGPYSTKRHGTTLATCDSEPAQTPGCIQDHGVLLLLRRSDLHVLQASDNTQHHLGLPAAQLLGQPVERVAGAAGVRRHDPPTGRGPWHHAAVSTL